MTYDPQKHHRRSIRLQGYDYSQPGAYFVTICTQNWETLFGEVVDGEMRLNDYGAVVDWTWHDLPNHIMGIGLDAFVIMPNHVHGIIVITNDIGEAGSVLVGAGSEPAPTLKTSRSPQRHPLPEIVRQFKTFSARRINDMRGTPSTPVWQRNYYEHIIRNESNLHRIRRYITENPLRWHLDRENPNRTGTDDEFPF